MNALTPPAFAGAGSNPLPEGEGTVERHPAARLAGMGKSIPSCQGEINRVFQPPPELRQGGIPSRGRKQGCFQPPGQMGLPGLAFRTWRSCGRAGGTAAPWWRGTPEVSPPSGWNEAYEPAILWGGGRADCPGLPRPTWKGAPAALGLGPAWLGPGGLRTLRSAQRTRGLASCGALR